MTTYLESGRCSDNVQIPAVAFATVPLEIHLNRRDRTGDTRLPL